MDPAAAAAALSAMGADPAAVAGAIPPPLAGIVAGVGDRTKLDRVRTKHGQLKDPHRTKKSRNSK